MYTCLRPIFVTQVLLFEGSITLCLPLQAALQGQEAIQKFPTVYIQTISSIVVFYSFFGVRSALTEYRKVFLLSPCSHTVRAVSAFD